MRVIISGRHLTVTPAMKKYAREKAQRLDRYHRGVETARIVLEVEHGDCIAEAVVSARRSTFVVSVHTGDMYAAIDKLMEKMERQLRRHKEKAARRRTPKKKIEYDQERIADDDE